jgi:dethiobiotin synthetase
MSVLLITGTSTEVGKTITTAAVAAAAAASGRTVGVCKPAQTGVAPGEPGDLAEVARLSGVATGRELVRYPEPLAPETAARHSGLAMLTLDETATAIEEFAAGQELTLVEGAGGLLVRFAPDFTMLELAQRLCAPVLLVTAAGLGTLNHTELTTRALDAGGVRCAGLVIGSAPAEPDLAARCNLTDLPRLTGVELIGSIPAGAGSWPPDRFRVAAAGWFTDALWDALA